MSETPTPPEAIEAALALCQRFASRNQAESDMGFQHADLGWIGFAREDAFEARRIAALLPKPVDEAVLACREILAASWDDGGRDRSDVADRYRSGENDSTKAMSNCLASYRAGAASTKGRG